MAKILLSIKPEYSKKILEGTKTFEYRKHLSKKNISRIVIYSTAPECSVVGEVEVLGTITMSRSKLWETTKCGAGISRDKFREYFPPKKNAHAYVLGKVYVYDIPKKLSDYGIKQAPQSFIYLDK